MACVCSLMRGATSLPKLNSHAINNCVLTQVRWRKPRWLPIAKSKLFYVREPTPINEEEHIEMKKLNNIYRTEMKTVRQFLKDWRQEIKTEGTSQEEIEKAEAEEHRRVLEVNRKWNEEVAIQREERQAKEIENKRIRLHEKMRADEEKQLEIMEEAIKYIQYETEQSKTFVTEERLDDEIEKLLNSRKDYNYALDSEGNKLVGTGESQKKEDNSG